MAFDGRRKARLESRPDDAGVPPHRPETNASPQSEIADELAFRRNGLLLRQCNFPRSEPADPLQRAGQPTQSWCQESAGIPIALGVDPPKE